MPLNMNYYVPGFQNFLMEEIMSDKEEISKVIQTYIDGMNFSLIVFFSNRRCGPRLAWRSQGCIILQF